MNKKVIFTIGGVAAMSAAIVIPSVLATNTSSEVATHKLLAAAPAATTAKSANFDPTTGPVIDPGNAKDYLAKPKEVRDPNKWYATYRNDEYDNYDPEMAYKYAAKYGWSMDDYRKYVHYHYETTLDKKLNEFGSVSGYINSSWMAFHPDSGLHNRGGTAITFWPGHESPIKPTYDGAERVESNHVDNNLTWYGYKDSMGAFVFDQNNLGNAFKRLKDDSFKRLEYKSLAEIKDEAGMKREAPGSFKLVESKRSDDPASSFVMVNGSLRPFTWFYSNKRDRAKYYYVTANNGTYIRDENGWKVVVSPDVQTWDDQTMTQDQVYDKMFTTVLNPINANELASKPSTTAPVAGTPAPITPWEPKVKDADATNKIRPDMEPIGLRFNDTSQGTVPHVTGGKGEEIKEGAVAEHGAYAGQATFTDNWKTDYGKYVVQNVAGLPKAVKTNGEWDYDFKDISVSAQGVYKLAYKEKSWLDLVASRAFVMTYQYYSSPNSNIVNKDRLFHETGELMWEGGDMNWMWCEDGMGGHKIFKKINIETTRTWDRATAKRIIGGDVEKDYHDWKIEVYDRLNNNLDINPNKRFWANYNHVFWNKMSFDANPDASKDGGY